MASVTSASNQLVDFLKRAKPSALSAEGSSEDVQIHDLIKSAYPDAQYSDAEKAELNQWIITSNHLASENEDSAKTSERLSSLNTHLSTRTTLLGSKPSVADLAIYARLAPVVAKWSADERTGEQGYHHIVRHVDFVQNASIFGLDLKEADKVHVDVDEVKVPIKPIDAKAEKERKKKEKEALAAVSASDGTTTPVDGKKNGATEQSGKTGKKEAKQPKSTGDVIAAAVGAEVPVGQPSAGVEKSEQTERKTEKREKKEKKPKAPAAPAVAAPLSPCLIDLRVGHILKAIKHPDADSLYVSTIACGDPAGTDNTSEYEGQVVRTVCSGLNGLVPLEEMQGRKIIAVCNLKPVTMRGIKSAAMVLAASPRLKEGEVDDHKGPVELVNPPTESKAGDRVYFEGWEGEPEGQLNPKKKIWEMCQVGFTTTGGKEVAFDAGAVKELEGKEGLGLLRTKDGLCSIPTLTGATVR